MPTLVKLSENRLGSKTITENGTYLSIDENLDGYAKVSVSVAGGGEAATEFEIAVADLNSSFSEIEGMPVSLIVDQMPLPDLLKSAPGRITSITNSVETEAEFEEGTLDNLGAPISTPMYMLNDETYTPSGNPYMYALVLAPGASVTSFNPATGECVATEDPDVLSIIGYCIEMDAEGNPIQSGWYIDSIKVYAATAEDLMKKRDFAWFHGRFPADFTIPDPDGSSGIPAYKFLNAIFYGPLTIPKWVSSIDDSTFKYAEFRNGLYIEEGTSLYRVGSECFHNIYANSTETPVQTLTLTESASIFSGAFQDARMPYVKLVMPYISSIPNNTFSRAELYSVNSDEQGTWILSSTDTSYLENILSENSLDCANAKKLILDFPNSDLTGSSHSLGGFITALEELRINISPSSSGSLSLATNASGDSSISTPIKMVCPNVVFNGGAFDAGYDTIFTNRLYYLDCRSPRPYGYLGAEACYFNNLETLVIRETAGVVGWFHSAVLPKMADGTGSIYVPDELLASYQEEFAEKDFVNAFKPLSEFPGE